MGIKEVVIKMPTFHGYEATENMQLVDIYSTVSSIANINLLINGIQIASLGNPGISSAVRARLSYPISINKGDMIKIESSPIKFCSSIYLHCIELF